MHESNGYIFTMNIKQLRKLFFICTSTLLVLPVGCSKEKMTYKPTEEVDLSDIDLNQLPISVDELQRYLLTQYIEYENYAGFTCNEIDYLGPGYAEYYDNTLIAMLKLASDLQFEVPVCENAEYYIAKAVSTYFVPNYAYEISSIYTYYGLCLAEWCGLTVDRGKIQAYIEKNELSYCSDSHNFTNYNYILEAYFTVLCCDKLQLSIDKKISGRILQNVSSALELIDYQDLTQVYNNLYQIQFALEIYNLRNKMPDRKTRTWIAEYVQYLVENEICTNTSKIVEVKLIFNLLGLEESNKLEAQVNESIENLYVDGGFTTTMEYKIPDVIMTAKFARLGTCVDVYELRNFLLTNIYENYITYDENPSNTDLRYYYQFVRLWGMTDETAAS